jgi:hypothetical protein
MTRTFRFEPGEDVILVVFGQFYLFEALGTNDQFPARTPRRLAPFPQAMIVEWPEWTS